MIKRSSKIIKSSGKTEAELLKVKIIIRKYIFKPLTNKKYWQELLTATGILPFEYHAATTLPIGNANKMKRSAARRRTNETEEADVGGEGQDEPKRSRDASRPAGRHRRLRSGAWLHRWTRSAHTGDAPRPRSAAGMRSRGTASAGRPQLHPYLPTECKGWARALMPSPSSSLKFTKFLPTLFCYRDTDIFLFIVIKVAGISRASELWYEWSFNL